MGAGGARAGRWHFLLASLPCPVAGTVGSREERWADDAGWNPREIGDAARAYSYKTDGDALRIFATRLVWNSHAWVEYETTEVAFYRSHQWERVKIL